MKVYLLQFIYILLLALLMSCSNSSNNQFKAQSDTVLHAGKINKEIIVDNYKYYLTSSVREIQRLPWERVVVDTVNDEFNRWIEAKLYYSSDEWIKIEAEDADKASVSSIETNSNYFLKNSPIKIEDNISTLILRDSVQFSFDEGKADFSIGSYEIKAKCLDKLDDLDYDRILEAREVRKKELLPDKIKACKVSSVRILNGK